MWDDGDLRMDAVLGTGRERGTGDAPGSDASARCPQWHLGPVLGHGLVLYQVWMQFWGVVLVQCH